MSKARYDEKTIERGLRHHLETGAIYAFGGPEEGKPVRWAVTVPGFALVEFTTPQAYALCVGLMAGERRCERELAARTGSVPMDVASLVDPDLDREARHEDFGNPEGSE